MSARILLVEDDPGTQELIQALCEARGDSVDIAADGFRGLRLLSERRHAVVLIDYHLPEMDGYALARLMREIVRPEDGVRLVGITADRHGLAARRNSDSLFDAILAKPIAPGTLYATLDRLTAPDTPLVTEAGVPEAGIPEAFALWRRRGLPGRPRAILRPEPDLVEAAAVSQAFDLTQDANQADLVLVNGEAGRGGLKALRADGQALLLPSVDLTGRLGQTCDLTFRVDDPHSWTELARTCQAFAARRSLLARSVRIGAEPATRLLAHLFVTDRTLPLSNLTPPQAGDLAAESAYETGFSQAGLMAAVMSLTEAGALACERTSAGVAIRLNPAGRGMATGGSAAEGAQPSTRDVDAPRRVQGRCEDLQPVSDLGWNRPRVAPLATGADAAPSPVAPEGPDAMDTKPESRARGAWVNTAKLDALRRLIGAEQLDGLHERLCDRLDTAFAADAEVATIAQDAHALISVAGSLGFDALSETCRSLQTAIARNVDVPRWRAEAGQAASEARAVLRPMERRPRDHKAAF